MRTSDEPILTTLELGRKEVRISSAISVPRRMQRNRAKSLLAASFVGLKVMEICEKWVLDYHVRAGILLTRREPWLNCQRTSELFARLVYFYFRRRPRGLIAQADRLRDDMPP